MSYSYKNGFREGVVFAFYKDGDVLIEHRPLKSGGTEAFFTNGSIEKKDHSKDNNYRVVALLREIREEFAENILPKEYCFLGELEVREIKVVFYVYVIFDWEGDMPEYTVEEGKRYAKLQWININEAQKYLKFDSALEMCKMIKYNRRQKIEKSSLSAAN